MKTKKQIISFACPTGRYCANDNYSCPFLIESHMLPGEYYCLIFRLNPKASYSYKKERWIRLKECRSRFT